jgi:hypothetical protein
MAVGPSAHIVLTQVHRKGRSSREEGAVDKQSGLYSKQLHICTCKHDVWLLLCTLIWNGGWHTAERNGGGVRRGVACGAIASRFHQQVATCQFHQQVA